MMLIKPSLHKPDNGNCAIYFVIVNTFCFCICISLSLSKALRFQLLTSVYGKKIFATATYTLYKVIQRQ